MITMLIHLTNPIDDMLTRPETVDQYSVWLLVS